MLNLDNPVNQDLNPWALGFTAGRRRLSENDRAGRGRWMPSRLTFWGGEAGTHGNTESGCDNFQVK